MKVLKIIIGVIVVLVVAVFIWLSMLPDSYRVERNIVINASPELVMENIVNFKNWENWSPWVEKDPNAAYTLSGVDGEVGASMRWEGNDSIGVGTMTITGIEENKLISYSLAFIKPWESSSEGVFKINISEEGTEVAWVDEGDLPFFMRWMGSAMDSWIGPDFEKGLAKMKVVVEELSANATPVLEEVVEEVEEVEGVEEVEEPVSD